jgi:hypothetical protein
MSDDESTDAIPQTNDEDTIDAMLFNKAAIGYDDDIDEDLTDKQSDDEDYIDSIDTYGDADKAEPTIIKNVVKRNIIKNRETSDYMSPTEFTSLLVKRVEIIDSNDDIIFVKYKKDQVNKEESTHIALLELIYKKFPLSLVRDVENNGYEFWSPNEMSFDTELIKKLGFDLAFLQSIYIPDE